MWNKCCWWLIPVSSCSTLIGNGWEHQALELQTNLREKFYHYWLWRRPVDVKIRHRSKSHKGQAVLRIYDNQLARLLKPLCRRPDFKSISLYFPYYFSSLNLREGSFEARNQGGVMNILSDLFNKTPDGSSSTSSILRLPLSRPATHPSSTQFGNLTAHGDKSYSTRAVNVKFYSAPRRPPLGPSFTLSKAPTSAFTLRI